MISPPRARIINRRSLLTPAGMTAENLRFIWAQVRAMAMLVDPLDASMTWSPAASCPLRQAFSRMYRAMRSLIDPLGFRNSSLHQICG